MRFTVGVGIPGLLSMENDSRNSGSNMEVDLVASKRYVPR